jgi:hypothetical protein
VELKVAGLNYKVTPATVSDIFSGIVAVDEIVVMDRDYNDYPLRHWFLSIESVINLETQEHIGPRMAWWQCENKGSIRWNP